MVAVVQRGVLHGVGSFGVVWRWPPQLISASARPYGVSAIMCA
jgi:hypothetical protein